MKTQDWGDDLEIRDDWASPVVLALNRKLKAACPGVDISSTDIEEGFNRPSFFVELELKAETMGTWRDEYNLPVKIYYFPKDALNHREEVLQKMGILRCAFRDKLAISETCMATIDDYESHVVDGVLIAEFSVTFTADLPTDETADYMEELQMKG